MNSYLFSQGSDVANTPEPQRKRFIFGIEVSFEPSRYPIYFTYYRPNTLARDPMKSVATICIIIVHLGYGVIEFIRWIGTSIFKKICVGGLTILLWKRKAIRFQNTGTRYATLGRAQAALQFRKSSFLHPSPVEHLSGTLTRVSGSVGSITQFGMIAVTHLTRVVLIHR